MRNEKEVRKLTARYEYDEMNRRTAVIDANGYRTVTGFCSPCRVQ